MLSKHDSLLTYIPDILNCLSCFFSHDLVFPTRPANHPTLLSNRVPVYDSVRLSHLYLRTHIRPRIKASLILSNCLISRGGAGEGRLRGVWTFLIRDAFKSATFFSVFTFLLAVYLMSTENTSSMFCFSRVVFFFGMCNTYFRQPSTVCVGTSQVKCAVTHGYGALVLCLGDVKTCTNWHAKTMMKI
ncbi:hypothetical protein BP00DRAFT_34762 [Aspergillus indologenus CBS 114.80]|uniref:Uncharacterized protein n=1 Tax=Aspergillus indologenus CBS 114.80 TaxID=1450541 RepID=A0A2V5HRJ8_9EURO|nr:hypothetical protein BP00DRAFT_34762 [Aspergillus indologenus CBS 114.80]